jgi:hypothetical protein
MGTSYRWKVTLFTSSGREGCGFSPSRFNGDGLRVSNAYHLQLKSDAIQIGENFVSKRSPYEVRTAEVSNRWANTPILTINSGKPKEKHLC